MLKQKKIKRPPERNWISLSIILTVVSAFVIYVYKDVLSQGDLNSFLVLVYMLVIWLLVFVYVLVNTLREKPDFEFRKSLGKIKKIEVYESWYFLSALGLIFGIVVWGIFSNIDKLLGTAICGILYTSLFAWIRDILKHRREEQS